MSDLHIVSQLSGTKNSLLGFASLHILANNYSPLSVALPMTAHGTQPIVGIEWFNLQYKAVIYR